ncbi:MAG: acetyl-CoA carboxylase carboxyltransferase subunit alpha [Verrucomicrobiota bacterium]|nr:acetyl-CoA carboxylase carboxyltransferase subunit alpha [Verrucomicrobiota bacterium]MEC7628053.1 acetyl-CoA carboxylase carboxyltransferase subunit alpha [Verrucomicrobiota bacterium]MEC8655280.1 acetyl-CoA carboxylase carboxyltransferase subunit alpha [Verrucomicrobiota bacterium]MEC8791445.1 acetyl-CoA carboxylase carboxyltransferase subunit alpha [Verrucomicrobiota bacterium]MEC8865821.1 acetyl-CoA carboxylase carboxyltransferase subunit alpha [Verrucomicrobiota bacterium]
MQNKKHSLEFEKPLLDLEKQLEDLVRSSKDSDLDFTNEIKAIEKKIEQTKRVVYADLSPWQKVQLSRHPNRPYALDYIEKIFTNFEELHGDRLFKDDAAIVGGPAELDGRKVMLIAQQKGRNTEENLKRNFGCPNPEGYRKALRLMKMADRFSLPVISIIDTPGAFPGIGAEERHVAEAIAVNLREMARLQVPILALVIGEGGSGGALGVAVADHIMILENAYYSVISPEGCAAILWKDRAYASNAAEALKLDAKQLLDLGIVDEVLDEPTGGAHRDWQLMSETISTRLSRQLVRLEKSKDLPDRRYEKFRAMGRFDS